MDDKKTMIAIHNIQQKTYYVIANEEHVHVK